MQECVLCIIDIIERAAARKRVGVRYKDTGNTLAREAQKRRIRSVYTFSRTIDRVIWVECSRTHPNGTPSRDTRIPMVKSITSPRRERSSPKRRKSYSSAFDKKSHVDAVEHLSFSNGSTYRLVASAVHAGAQFTGHYMAFTKHGGKWSFRDDEICRECELEKTAGHYFMAYARQKTP